MKTVLKLDPYDNNNEVAEQAVKCVRAWKIPERMWPSERRKKYQKKRKKTKVETKVKLIFRLWAFVA